jgi:arsenate reductase (thioredoxin)
VLDTHIMTQAQRKCLLSAARDLHEQFRGVFGEETIQALLFSSYAELAAQATIDRWLVLGAERFTRQRLRALVHAESHATGRVPGVLFLCVHNAGRSQMALGWFTHLAQDRAIGWSGGAEPAAVVSPEAVAAMAEVASTSPRSSPNPGPTSSS